MSITNDPNGIRVVFQPQPASSPPPSKEGAPTSPIALSPSPLEVALERVFAQMRRRPERTEKVSSLENRVGNLHVSE